VRASDRSGELVDRLFDHRLEGHARGSGWSGVAGFLREQRRARLGCFGR